MSERPLPVFVMYQENADDGLMASDAGQWITDSDLLDDAMTVEALARRASATVGRRYEDPTSVLAVATGQWLGPTQFLRDVLPDAFGRFVLLVVPEDVQTTTDTETLLEMGAWFLEQRSSL